MTKLIIDAQTGTIIDIKEAYIVDEMDMDFADADILNDGSDSEIAAVARRIGKLVEEKK